MVISRLPRLKKTRLAMTERYCLSLLRHNGLGIAASLMLLPPEAGKRNDGEFEIAALHS